MTNIAQNLEVSDSNPTLLLGHKFTVSQQKKVLDILEVTPKISSPMLIQKMKEAGDPLSITERHLNRVRLSWALNRNQGRPKREEESVGSKKKRNNIN